MLLRQLIEDLQGEGFSMYTMKDFERDYFAKHFLKLTPEEQEDVLRAFPPEKRLAGIPPEKRLAGLSEEQIRQYLDQLTSGHKTATRKTRRKKK
jgi:hypothetical protein